MCPWSISHKIWVRYKKNNWGLPNLPKLHSLRLVPEFYLANSCQRQDVQIKKWYICIMHESAPVVWFLTQACELFTYGTDLILIQIDLFILNCKFYCHVSVS